MSLAFNVGWAVGLVFCTAFSTWALTTRIADCEREGSGLCIVRVDWSRAPFSVPITFTPAPKVSK